MRRRALALGAMAAMAAMALTAVTLGAGSANAGAASGGLVQPKPAAIGLIRLPTLVPGLPSIPVAVDGALAVGNATVRYESGLSGADAAYWERSYDHAAMWDLSDPHPVARDLGTLGGDESHVSGFSGRWVVGSADTSAGVQHAFALDATTGGGTMMDLDPAGGRSSATAVDRGIVVGAAQIGGRTQAFAEDLNASSPHMMALGDLGAGSEATTIRDGFVAGTATSPVDGLLHAFSVDLNSSHRTMRDLGPVSDGGYAPRALGPTAVERPVVVGAAATQTPTNDGHYHAFAVDTSGAAPAMRDLGSGATDNDSAALDVRHGIVVGTDVRNVGGKPKQTFGFAYDSRTQRRTQLVLGTEARVFHVDDSGAVFGASSDGGEHAFTFNAADSTPSRTDLGRLSGSDAVATGGGDVVMFGALYRLGTSYGDGLDGAVWPVGNAIRLTRAAVSVPESVGSAGIPVIRTGDLSKPASVRYRAVGGTARVGRDFTERRGTLRFAAGQRRATISIPVTDDSRAERSERFSVRLSAPSAGQQLLGSHTTVAIETSDQRPDAEVSRTPRRRYVGDDVYNTTGRHQTLERVVRRGETARFYVRLRNDGNSAIALLGRRRHVPSALHVTYHQGGSDLTYAFTHGGWEPLLPLGHTLTIRLDVSVDSSARVGASWTPTVVAQWRGDHLRTDTVGTKVAVGR